MIRQTLEYVIIPRDLCRHEVFRTWFVGRVRFRLECLNCGAVFAGKLAPLDETQVITVENAPDSEKGNSMPDQKDEKKKHDPTAQDDPAPTNPPVPPSQNEQGDDPPPTNPPIPPDGQ